MGELLVSLLFKHWSVRSRLNVVVSVLCEWAFGWGWSHFHSPYPFWGMFDSNQVLGLEFNWNKSLWQKSFLRSAAERSQCSSADTLWGVRPCLPRLEGSPFLMILLCTTNLDRYTGFVSFSWQMAISRPTGHPLPTAAEYSQRAGCSSSLTAAAPDLRKNNTINRG